MNLKPKDIPILVIAFNRPDKFKEVLRTLRNLGPKKLYIAIDGPRENKEGEDKLVSQTISLLDEIDWDCQIFTKIENENLGSRYAPIKAMDWVFKHEEMAIILEDDINPSSSFFDFCSELLTFYRNDSSVLAISGFNALNDGFIRDSYRFSAITHGWGWATWRRTWELYPKDEFDNVLIPSVREFKTFFNCTTFEALQLKRIFNAVKRKKINAWDFQFVFMAMKYGANCATSNSNLVENTGFGVNSTHTKVKPDFILPLQNIHFPLTHPLPVRDISADSWIIHNAYGVNFTYIIKRIPEKIVEELKNAFKQKNIFFVISNLKSKSKAIKIKF